MSIRSASEADAENVRRLCRSAFPAEEREEVAGLAVALLGDATPPGTLSLLSVNNGIPDGLVAFSPLSLESGEDLPAYLLAPLAVDTTAQGRGIGTRLVKAGLGELESRGVELLYVYGDPAYYGRFGFEVADSGPYEPPYPLKFSFGWQVLKFVAQGNLPASGKLQCVSPLQDPALW